MCHFSKSVNPVSFFLYVTWFCLCSFYILKLAMVNYVLMQQAGHLCAGILRCVCVWRGGGPRQWSPAINSMQPCWFFICFCSVLRINVFKCQMCVLRCLRTLWGWSLPVSNMSFLASSPPFLLEAWVIRTTDTCIIHQSNPVSPGLLVLCTEISVNWFTGLHIDNISFRCLVSFHRDQNGVSCLLVYTLKKNKCQPAHRFSTLMKNSVWQLIGLYTSEN